MSKHKLIELQKLIEVKVGSLIEEVEIGTNIQLNALCMVDRRDKIQFLQWTTRINSVYLKSGILREATAWRTQKAIRNDGRD